MEYSKFVVDEKPYAAWGHELEKQGQQFLRSIDPSYFQYLAKLHMNGLNEQDTTHAALALRNSYHHGFESFFSILCAAIQAPECILAWLLRYQTRDVRQLVRKIQNNESVYFKIPVRQPTWLELSAFFNRFELDTEKHTTIVREQFALFWQRFAKDFLDERGSQEYNSIKHGFRVISGGSSLAVGIQPTKGVAADPENMFAVSNKFGSTYYTWHNISDKMNFQIKQHSLNWEPENFRYGLELISISINNIITCLKEHKSMENGDYQWPLNLDDFHLPWHKLPSFEYLSSNIEVQEQQIRPASKDDIMSYY